jgi:hypothetical protein
MGVVDTSPPVPRKDGEGAYEQDGEHAPIASIGPRLGGSTLGYTSWRALNADNCRYVCTAPPRPAETLPMLAETNTSHTSKRCGENLA